MTELYRAIGASVLLVCAAMMGACSAGSSSQSYPTQQANNVANQGPAARESSPGLKDQADIAGLWQGTTLAYCAANMPFPDRCNAQQNVTITLLQGADLKLTGKYTCSYLNMDCFHANSSGKVIGVTTHGKLMSIRVLMPDATSCIFVGRNVNQNINGGYTCYGGGGLIEQGSWRARRSY